MYSIFFSIYSETSLRCKLKMSSNFSFTNQSKTSLKVTLRMSSNKLFSQTNHKPRLLCSLRMSSIFFSKAQKLRSDVHSECIQIFFTEQSKPFSDVVSQCLQNFFFTNQTETSLSCSLRTSSRFFRRNQKPRSNVNTECIQNIFSH